MNIPSGLNPSAEQWARQVNSQLDFLLGQIMSLQAKIADTKPTSTGFDPIIKPQPLSYSLAADVTFTTGDLDQVHVVNCTSSCAITLPPALEGRGVTIENVGTGTLTVKNNAGTAIGTITQYQRAIIPCLKDSSIDPSWPLGFPVWGSSSELYTSGDLVFDDETVGPCLYDGTSKWWRIDVDTSGNLSTTDLGTSKPSPPEPI